MKIFIACGAHGISGAAVEYTDSSLRKLIKQTKKRFTAEQCRDLHKILKTELATMLPKIMEHGLAKDSYGEYYTTEKFDTDLVYLAVYDHIGNNKQIGLVSTPIVH